jgi:hypothetical protein
VRGQLPQFAAGLRKDSRAWRPLLIICSWRSCRPLDAPALKLIMHVCTQLVFCLYSSA